MTQTIDAHRVTVGALLGRYERRPVVLPAFQRSYSWEKAQNSVFWGDLLGFVDTYNAAPLTASYFLGSIVTIESESEILLLDGQQRLATSTIAFAALRDFARDLDRRQTPPGQKGSDFARDIQRELLEKDTEPVTHSLSLSELDEPFFAKSIKTDPRVTTDSKLRSHVAIRAAYDLAMEQIADSTSDKSYEETLRILKAIRDSLSKGVTLISIVVQSEEDAYNIFETLNDRGLRLSVPDLVLNLLMKRAPDATARDLVRQSWNAMLRQMGRRDIARFLRHMWVSMYGDVKNVGLYAAIKKSLESEKVKSVEFAELCGEECEVYVTLLDLDVSLPTAEAHNDLEGIIKYLGIAFAPPLLLAGLRCLEMNDFVRLLRFITATYVRYVVTANQNPVDLESAFYEAARELRAKQRDGASSASQLQATKAVLSRFVVEDEAVRIASEATTLERTEAIWILTRIATRLQSETKELRVDEVTLEHIFPQKAGGAWPNREELDQYVWHLGNLTVLGGRLNRQAQNKGFKEKLDQHYSKSEIVMTKALSKYSSWDAATVKSRAKYLAGEINREWKKLD